MRNKWKLSSAECPCARRAQPLFWLRLITRSREAVFFFFFAEFLHMLWQAMSGMLGGIMRRGLLCGILWWNICKHDLQEGREVWDPLPKCCEVWLVNGGSSGRNVKGDVVGCQRVYISWKFCSYCSNLMHLCLEVDKMIVYSILFWIWYAIFFGANFKIP